MNQLAQVKEWVDEVTYIPGWDIEVLDDPHLRSVRVAISVLTEDAYHPGVKVRIGSTTFVPRFIESLEDFADWLGSVLAERAIHESREWFKYKATGKPVHDPHQVDAYKTVL